MREMMIRIVTNFIHDGNRKELVEELKSVIPDPPERKDSSKISNLVKKWFEDELCRTVVVKTKIKKDSVVVVVNIKQKAGEK